MSVISRHRPDASKKRLVECIRRFCHQCMGGSSQFVTSCGNEGCPLHAYRRGSCETAVFEEMVAAVGEYCLSCAGDDVKDVLSCSALASCPLWFFRVGNLDDMDDQFSLFDV